MMFVELQLILNISEFLFPEIWTISHYRLFTILTITISYIISYIISYTISPFKNLVTEPTICSTMGIKENKSISGDCSERGRWLSWISTFSWIQVANSVIFIQFQLSRQFWVLWRRWNTLLLDLKYVEIVSSLFYIFHFLLVVQTNTLCQLVTSRILL